MNTHKLVYELKTGLINLHSDRLFLIGHQTYYIGIKSTLREHKAQLGRRMTNDELKTLIESKGYSICHNNASLALIEIKELVKMYADRIKNHKNNIKEIQRLLSTIQHS